MSQHQVKLTIKNYTSEPLVFQNSWSEYGQGVNFSDVPASSDVEWLIYRSNLTVGCSGYMVFNHKTMSKVTVAFSNPLWGENRINVKMNEPNEKSAWDEMVSHYDKPMIITQDGFKCQFSNTIGDDISYATVEFWELQG